MDSNLNIMQFKQQLALTVDRPMAADLFGVPRRSASSASHRSLVSVDTQNFLEGGKSQSSKRTGQQAQAPNADQRQGSVNANNQATSQAVQHGHHGMADQRGQSGNNKSHNNNQHRNSKNRKLYTSIGAYNQGSKQGFMVSGGLPGGMVSGPAGLGLTAHGPMGGQAQLMGQGSLQAALVRNMQHSSIHQQRNAVLSQQQSLAKQAALLPEADEPDQRRQQVQHLLSHQSSLNQSNQSNMQHLGANHVDVRASKATRDRGTSKKSANSSVLVVPSRDLMVRDESQQQQYNRNTGHNPMDSSQISMMSRPGAEGALKDSLGTAQMAAYQTSGPHGDPSHGHSTFHDSSVVSGPDSTVGAHSYNTALIVKQRGLNNMSQIVATNTSSQLAGGAGHAQAVSKYKNANVLGGFNSHQPAMKERGNHHGQATHSSVIIEKNSSSDKGAKQVKRNTLVKINNQGMKQHHFTQFGNYMDSQSKEYLENSFHEVKGVSRAIANQSEIQKSQTANMGQGKIAKAKLQTIGSSNKVNKHATVGASDSLCAQQLAQNQVNFISNFHIEENEQVSESKKGGSSTNPPSNMKPANLAKNQQNYVLLQQHNNNSLNQKQRPHSSFKAQTQKPINTFKQHLVNLNGAQTQHPSSGGNAPAEALSGKGQPANNNGAQAHTSGRRAPNQSQQQQQLLIGADGVVGFGGIGSAGSLAQGKSVGSRKSKHLAQPMNLNKAGKNILIGKTQKLNQMSVYQNQMVGEMNHREPRRIGRGGSGIDASGLGVRNELSNITKDHREMRTSSAAAGNTNTEFKLLNLTGTAAQGHSGNALNNGAGGLFNLNNHNQNYQVGGPGPGGASASHVMSGISAISGHSGGAASTHTAILTIPSNKGTTQASGNHMVFNATTGSHKASTSTKVPSGKNKSSKRNIAAPGGANSGVPSFPIENILSSTNKSLINASNTEQMMLLQNIDSIRSGDGGLATRGSVLGAAGTVGLMSTGSKNPAGYGINLHPAKLYDQDQRQNFNKSATGGALRASSKASKGSVRQSILSGNGAPSKPSDNANLAGQANRAHQQSMQKFLQQQMTMYNISQNPPRAGPSGFNNQGAKNAKRASGLAGISTGTASKQSTSKQREGQIMNYYNSNLQNFQYMSNSSQVQAQGYQGQSVSHGPAQPQGQGSGGGKGLKSSAQKLTKKQIQQQNLLASDRLRGVQQQRDNKEAFRKGGTQTAIGTGSGPTKNGVLNSNQLQVQRQSSQKNQSQSLSRSRVTSQNRQQQVVNANNRHQQAGSGASSAQGNKKGIKALSSVPGQTPAIGALGSISATPGIHVNQKINLMNQDGGANSAALAAHQRNFYSQIQRSSNSTKTRFDAYKVPHAEDASGRAPTNAQHDAAGLATTLSSAAALHLQEHQSSNRDVHFRGNGQSNFDVLELTQQQLRQIQIAENAVNEMRVALNQHKADSTVVMVTGEGSTDKQQQSQPRPRSQNDVHSNFVHIDGVDSDGLADMMALVPPREVDLPEHATGPLDAMSYQSKHQDATAAAFAAPDNQQSRLWSQERPQKMAEEENAVNGSLEFMHQGFSDTQGVNSTFIEKNESKQAENADDEIDKEQFLIIVSNAFEKIMAAMHPSVGGNLRHIKNMYTHFIEQVESNHHQQLQENAIRLQGLQSAVTDLQVQNQSLQLQISQKVSLHEEKQVQLSSLASKNKELQMQMQKMQKTVDENRMMKANYNKLKESFEKQKRQIEHFKNNIEGVRSLQDQHERAGRDGVGRAVIKEMKQNMAVGKKESHGTQSRELERLKRMELNERTKEVAEQLDPGVFMQDDASSIVGGIPEFTAAELENDPLDLDGDIGRIGKLNFGKNHVRITNGDIIEENQAFSDAIEQDQDTGRIADRFGRDRNESRLGHRAKKSRRGPNDDLTEDEVADVELSSIPSYDMSKMQGDQQRIQDEMIAELEFDDGDDTQNELGRNPEETQSYFSSRIHSSSETLNSEMMLAYQQAIRMNGGALPDSKLPLAATTNQTNPKMNARRGQKDNAMRIEQDKSSAGGPHSKIRVPALDFNILQNNQEQEMNQEEHQLDDDHQELQDLVDAADGIERLDQDRNDMVNESSLQPQDQNAPPTQMKAFGKHKVADKSPIMNISMLENKGTVPSQFAGGPGPLAGTQGPSQANETAGVTRAAHGLGLGFSIDLTKLKGKPGEAQDDNGAQGNDYQLQLPNAKPQDFQDEFMAKYDEFSESWRMMLRKQKRF